MSSTLEQLSPTRVKLTIDKPFNELESAIKAAYKQIAEQINIPGFRKGKVPPRLIDQRFGRGVVLQEAINNQLPQFYAEAVSENNIHPLGQPEIDVTELNDGKNVVLTAEVDVRPVFEIADTTDLKIEVPVAEVSDEEVEERVNLLRERFGTLTPVEREAETGDVVVINLTARQDGKVLEDAEATDVQYKIGAGGMVEGMDEALTGMKTGEKKTITSTLIGGVNRGEEAEIEIEVTKVQNQELPEVDDEFAQMVSEFDTAEQMYADLRDNLERMARIGQANQAREQVLQNIVDRTVFELPEALVENERTTRRENIEQQLQRAGLTLEQYLADAEEEDAETPEQFWETLNNRIVEGLRSQIILDKYAEDNEVQVSQQELTELIFAKAQQNGTSPEQELQHMMEHNHAAEWMEEARRGKALGQLVSSVTIVDANGEEVFVSRLQSDGTLAPAEASDEAEKATKPAKEEADAKPAKEEADAKSAKKAPVKKTAAEKKADAKPAKKAPVKKTAVKKTDEAEA